MGDVMIGGTDLTSAGKPQKGANALSKLLSQLLLTDPPQVSCRLDVHLSQLITHLEANTYIKTYTAYATIMANALSRSHGKLRCHAAAKSILLVLP